MRADAEPVKVYGTAPKRWQIEGDRIGLIDGRAFLVSDTDGADWTSIAPTLSVSNFQLHAQRIAYVYLAHHDSFLRVREDLDAPDVGQGNHISYFQLSGDRLAVDGANGFWMKEGALDAERIVLYDSLDRIPFYLDRDRIGYVKDGDLWIVDGEIGTEPGLAVEGVDQHQVDGDRIAENDPAAGFQVKEGAPDAGFVTISAAPVKAFQIGADIHPPVRQIYWT